MGRGLEARFEAYCDKIMNLLLHADREQSARRRSTHKGRCSNLLPSAKWDYSDASR